MSVYDVLKERGFLKQLSHEDEIKELLEKEKITFYIGFDPTADSLHVGHFIALMVMSHMQRAGHRPICLLGGGTGMVGDPSGKDDMRKMLTPEFISHNIACFKKQMARFIDFSEGQAIMVNNADCQIDNISAHSKFFKLFKKRHINNSHHKFKIFYIYSL